MAFRASAGRITVTDAADLITVFDSDEGLFSASDFVTGSITTPARQAFFDGTGAGVEYPLDYEEDHVLDTVNADADIVLGGFKVTTSVATGLSGLGWHQTNGTYMHYVESTGPLTRPTEQWFPTNYAAYTFKCVAGTLYLNERVQMRAQITAAPVFVTLTLLAVTFDYKVYCGRLV